MGHGTDPVSKWYGDLTDQHTNDRYHAIWNLKPYNPRWQATSITVEHESASA